MSSFLESLRSAPGGLAAFARRQTPVARFVLTIVATAVVLACGESVLPTEPGPDLKPPTRGDWLDSTGTVIVDSTAATIATDRSDYAPGDTVVITGVRWAPGETVHLLLEEVQALHEPRTWNVVASDSGSIEDRSFSPEEHHVGVTFVLSATGESSGSSAVTHFTDGPVTVTPANASISSDKAAPTGAFTTLTGPSIREANVGDIGSGTLIINAPAAFAFDVGGTAPSADAPNSGCSNAGGTPRSNVAATLAGRTASSLTFTVTAGVSRICTLTFKDIRVRPVSGTIPGGAQNITVSGTSAISGVNSSTNFGALTQIAGATAKLVLTLPGQTFASGTNSGSPTAQTAGTSFNIVKITATDQFGNVATAYSGAKTISYSGPGNNGASFMPSYTTAVSFTSGVSTTTLATTLKKAESTTITAGDGVISGPASSTLAVNAGALSSFLVTATDGNAIPTQAAGTPFDVQFRAIDTGGNTVTSFSGGNNKVVVSSTGTLSAGSGNSLTFSNGLLASHSVTFSSGGNYTIAGTRFQGGTESGTSNPFTVTAPTCASPAVTTQPVDASVTYPSNASFTAAASGTPVPSVQWQVKVGTGSFTDIPGETSTTLVLTSPPVSSSTTQYRAVFTNTCGGTQTSTTNAATLTVASQTITVTPTSGQTKVYGASDPTLAYTLSQAVSVTGALSRAPGEDVGDYAITLGTLSAGSSYSLALSGTVNFSVTKANQAALVWSTAPPASAAYGTSFSVAASGGSGDGAIGYSSSGGCTNTGASFTMTSGTTACVVKADKAADVNHFAAAQLSTNVSASADPTTTTVTSSAASNTSAFGESVTFTATVTGSVVSSGSVSFRSGGTSCTEGLEVQGPLGVSGTGQVTYATSALAVGTHTIRACFAGTDDYSASSGSITHTVGKATAAVTLINLSQTYDGTAKSAGATTAPGGLTVGFTYDGSATAPTNAGTYAVVATVTSDDYQGSASGSLVIGKASGSVSISNIPSSATFGGTFTPSYDALGDGSPSTSSLTTSVCTVSAGVVSFVGSGQCQLRASIAEGTNYLAATGSTQSFTIGKASATITLTAADLSQTYNGSARSVSYTTNPAGLSGVTVTYSQGGSPVASPTNAGSYEVTASLDNAGYSATNATGTLVIGKADQAALTISAPTAGTFGEFYTMSASGGSTSGSIAFAVVAGSTACSIASGGPNNGKLEITSGTGQCSFTATKAGDSNYNDVTAAAQSVVVSKAAGSVTISGPASITYNSSGDASVTNKTGAGAVTFAKVSGPCSVTSGGSVTMTSGAGTCKVNAELAETGNYTSATSNEISIEAAKAAATITLTAADLAQTYNGSGKTVGYATSPSGISGVTVSYAQGSTPVISPTNAGSYDVRASLASDNYSATDAIGTLVIAKANQSALTISAPTAGTFGEFYAMSASGGSTSGTITFEVVAGSTACSIVSGGPNDGKLQITSGTGSCSFTATRAGDINYNDVTSTAQNVAVSKATPTFLFSVSSLPAKTFGDASFSVSSYATTNSDGGMTFATASGSTGCTVTSAGEVTITGAAVGTSYCVIAASLASSSNYLAAGPTSQQFHIAKAAATITLVAADLAQTYSATSKTVGYTTSPADLAGVTVSYAQSGSAVTPKAAGSYDVSASMDNANYAATTATGTLVIAQKPVTGSFTGINKVYDGTAVAQVTALSLSGVLSADASLVALSGGTATFSDKDVGVGKTVTLTGAGLTGAGALNYSLSSVSTGSADITPAAVTVSVSATPSPTQYSDKVTLTPTVTPTASGLQSETVNGTVTLKIGSRVVATNVVPGAATEVILTEMPGSYTVTAEFTPSTPSNFAAGSGTKPLTVGPENASAAYSGPLYAVVNSNGQAGILLQAVIYDAVDGNPGDVRNARVTFIDRNTKAPIGSCKDLKVDVAAAGNTTIGNVACSWTASLSKGDNAASVTVGTVITNAYGDNTQAEDVEIMLSRALPNTITGVGRLTGVSPVSSLGSITGEAHFGFFVSYNKTLTSLQGGGSISFTASGKTYWVKTNSMVGLAVNADSGTASFTSKANIQDVTNPDAPIAVDGNITVQLDMTDASSGADKLGITIYGKNGGVLYSNYYTAGGKTAQQSLGSDPNSIIVR